MKPFDTLAAKSPTGVSFHAPVSAQSVLAGNANFGGGATAQAGASGLKSYEMLPSAGANTALAGRVPPLSAGGQAPTGSAHPPIAMKSHEIIHPSLLASLGGVASALRVPRPYEMTPGANGAKAGGCGCGGKCGPCGASGTAGIADHTNLGALRNPLDLSTWVRRGGPLPGSLMIPSDPVHCSVHRIRCAILLREIAYIDQRHAYLQNVLACARRALDRCTNHQPIGPCVELIHRLDDINRRIDDINTNERAPFMRAYPSADLRSFDDEIRALHQSEARLDLDECARYSNDTTQFGPYSVGQARECRLRAETYYRGLEFYAAEENDWYTKRGGFVNAIRMMNAANPDCEPCQIPDELPEATGENCPPPWDLFSRSSSG